MKPVTAGSRARSPSLCLPPKRRKHHPNILAASVPASAATGERASPVSGILPTFLGASLLVPAKAAQSPKLRRTSADTTFFCNTLVDLRVLPTAACNGSCITLKDSLLQRGQTKVPTAGSVYHAHMLLLLRSGRHGRFNLRSPSKIARPTPAACSTRQTPSALHVTQRAALDEVLVQTISCTYNANSPFARKPVSFRSICSISLLAHQCVGARQGISPWCVTLTHEGCDQLLALVSTGRDQTLA